MRDLLPRPTVLTREVQASILQAVAAGNFPTTACVAAGITYDTLRYWQKKWENQEEDAQRFADFFVALKASVAIGECAALANLKRGDPGWQAQAWFLERRFSKKWAKKEQAAQPQIDVSKLTREQLQAIVDGKSPSGT